MDWAAIIAMIIELIGNCRESQTRDRVEKRVKTPGMREWLSLRVKLRRDGLSGRDVREAVAKAQAEITQCQAEGCWDDCCDDLLNQAEALNTEHGKTNA